jgi:methionyl-tRNA synthetase
MTEISFDDWKNMDLRVAEITDVQDHPKADRLYVLQVDLGEEKRTVVAGLKQHYDKKELLGKKVVVFVNLKPAELRGVTSNGMVLAAVEGDGDRVILLTPEEDIAVGAKIR